MFTMKMIQIADIFKAHLKSKFPFYFKIFMCAGYPRLPFPPAGGFGR